MKRKNKSKQIKFFYISQQRQREQHCLDPASNLWREEGGKGTNPWKNPCSSDFSQWEQKKSTLTCSSKDQELFLTQPRGQGSRAPKFQPQEEAKLSLLPWVHGKRERDSSGGNWKSQTAALSFSRSKNPSHATLRRGYLLEWLFGGFSWGRRWQSCHQVGQGSRDRAVTPGWHQLETGEWGAGSTGMDKGKGILHGCLSKQ